MFGQRKYKYKYRCLRFCFVVGDSVLVKSCLNKLNQAGDVASFHDTFLYHCVLYDRLPVPLSLNGGLSS